MTAECERILSLLESVQKRPGMYFGANLLDIHVFLEGMRQGLAIHNLNYDEEVYKSTVQGHGWEYRPAQSLFQQLLAKGLSHTEIFNEILSVEIETWRSSFTK